MKNSSGFLAALVAFATTAFAQADCFMAVHLPNVEIFPPVGMTVVHRDDNPGTFQVQFLHGASDGAGNMYNVFRPDGRVLESDRILIGFQDGSVGEFKPDRVIVSEELGAENGMIAVGFPVLAKLLASPGPVRVEFHGSNGSAAIIVRHDIILDVARQVRRDSCGVL